MSVQIAEYVVDASILIKGFIREPETPQVESLLAGLKNPASLVIHVTLPLDF